MLLMQREAPMAMKIESASSKFSSLGRDAVTML